MAGAVRGQAMKVLQAVAVAFLRETPPTVQHPKWGRARSDMDPVIGGRMGRRRCRGSPSLSATSLAPSTFPRPRCVPLTELRGYA